MATMVTVLCDNVTASGCLYYANILNNENEHLYVENDGKGPLEKEWNAQAISCK